MLVATFVCIFWYRAAKSKCLVSLLHYFQQQFISFANDVDYSEGKVCPDGKVWKCLICMKNNPNYRRKCTYCSTMKILASSKKLLDKSWACLKCSSLNFSSDKKCAGCEEDNLDYSEIRFKGDWDCPMCSTLNYAKRKKCLKCRYEKPKHLTWNCEDCDAENYSHRYKCLKCSKRRKTWICVSCNENNSRRQSRCSKCEKEAPFVKPKRNKPKTKKSQKSVQVVRPGDWICPKCDKHYFARVLKCNKCLELKPM